MKIREATTDDLATMVAYGQVMFEESQFSQYKFNGEKTYVMLKYLIEEDEGIVLLAEEENQIVGGFIGGVANHWFGDCVYAYDFALFVHPKFRNSQAAHRLLKQYVASAKEKGVDEITIGASTGVHPDKVDKLYKQLGFTYYGGNYRMNAEK